MARTRNGKANKANASNKSQQNINETSQSLIVTLRYGAGMNKNRVNKQRSTRNKASSRIKNTSNGEDAPKPRRSHRLTERQMVFGDLPSEEEKESDVDFEPGQLPQPDVITTQVRRSARQASKVTDKLQKTIGGRVTKPKSSRSPKKSKGDLKQSSQLDETNVVSVNQPKSFVRKRTSKHLKITLSNIDYSKLGEDIQGQDWKILKYQERIQNYKGRYLPAPLHLYNNSYGFKFDHDPFLHRNFQGPSVDEQWNAYNLMKKDLKENFNKDCFLDQPDASTNQLQDGPLHMTDDLSVDNLVKVILSIATENSLAIRQHAQLCSKFTFTVDGKEVRGTVPNYHKMRICSASELASALNISGQQNIRQRSFHAILKEVYDQNISRMMPWEVLPEGNLANAPDFIPGLLSMDYLKQEGLSKQERLDLLVRFPQIAVKTGCCLLAFNLKIPVFVVDTHVHNMVRDLGWVPADCYEADRACMFMDKIMPKELKFGLHQAFWHHRINCVRCSPRANPKSQAYQERVCPLENLMNRNLPSLRKAIRGGNPDETVKSPKAKKPKPERKSLPSSVTFLKMHCKIAEEKGYALRKVEIDDDFGEGSRQNKDGLAAYYWNRKEFTLDANIVKIEDALVDINMAVDAYEARFVKKKKKRAAKKTAVKKENGDDQEDIAEEEQIAIAAEDNEEGNEEDASDSDNDITDNDNNSDHMEE